MPNDYNAEKLEELCRDFYNATGVSLHILNEGFNWIDFERVNLKQFCTMIQASQKGHDMCKFCDTMLMKKCYETKKAARHICHAGLVDVVVPILQKDIIVGYIIMGQMKTDKKFFEIEKNIQNLSVDTKKLENIYDKMECFDEKKVEGLINLAKMMAAYITTEKMLWKTSYTKLEKAIIFVKENITQNLTIDDIAKGSQVSKSMLYKLFSTSFGCTVSEYVKTKKIEKSIDLLLNDDLSIEEISEKLGFSSASYYSKTFKKIKGISPGKFREAFNENKGTAAK